MSRAFGRALLVLVAVVLLAPARLFAASGEYRALVLSHNPAAYYPLDESTGTTASDISGNGLDGAYNNVLLGSGGALGSATTSAVFDGGSSYVQLPGSWGGGSSITIEAWVWIDNTSVNPQAIVSSTGSSDFVHFQAKDSGNNEFYVDAAQLQTLAAVPETPINTWRHVVLVLSSGNSKLYIDGVQSGSSAATFTSITSSSDVRIGMGTSPGRFLNGRIDEVAIYNTALSQAQIQSHFAAQPDGPIESIASGNWSSAGTWKNGLVPTSLDNVQINGSHTVTVDVASVTVNDLTVLGLLDVASFGMTVTNDLTVAGTVNGIVDLTLTGTPGSELRGLGTINAPVKFDAGSRSIPGGESPDFTGSVSVDGSVTNGGDATMTNVSGLTGSGSWTQGSTGMLRIEGPVSVTSFSASAIGNTVELTGSAQTVRGTTYYHLAAAGPGEVRTLDGIATITGNFSIEGTFEDDGYQITGPGFASGKTLTLNGTARLQLGTFDGAQPTSGTSMPAFDNYVFDGATVVAYDARAAQSIAALPYSNLEISAQNVPPVSITKTAAGTVTTTGTLLVEQTLGSTITFDLAGNGLVIGGDLAGSGTISHGGGTILLEGSNTIFTGSITPTYDITFSGANAQSIRGISYDALTINKISGTATLAGNATATFLTLTAGTLSDGNFILSSGGTVNLGFGTTLRIAASMPAGTHITDPASNVYYEGDGNQTISLQPAYGNLFLTTGVANATKTLGGAGTLFAQSLTLTNGAPGTVTLDLGGQTLDVEGNINGDGSLLLSGGTLFIGGDINTSGAFDATTALVKYDGAAAQTVRGTAYNDLHIDKSGGTATLGGNASVSNLLDVNTGTFNLASFSMGVNGTLEVDGTLQLAASTLNLAGDVNVNSSGSIDGGTSSTVQITGGSLQTWGGGSTAAIILESLAITGVGGMQLSGGYDLAVDATLNLGGGDLRVTNPRKLTITTNGTITRTSGAVRGLLAFQIPAGQMRRFETATNSSGSYSPIEITSANAATINVFVDDASSTNRVGATWTLSGDPTTVDLKYFWQNGNWSGDIRGFVPARFALANWTFPTGYVDYSTYFASANGISAYDGDWTAGYAQFFGATGPSVANFSPTFGPPGTSVQIFGSNLTGVTSVSFNGTTADTMLAFNDNEVFAEVPALATTGPITVDDGAANDTSFDSFTVSTPATIQTAQSGNWTSTSTWQGGVVPAAFDSAVINHAVSVDANVTIADIDVNANLIGGSFTVQVDGTMTWNNGTISAPVNVSGTMDVVTAGSHILDADVQNSGTINVSGNHLVLTNGANLSNSGNLNLVGDYNLVWDAVGAPATIYNLGTIAKTGGAGTSLLGGGATLTNADTMEVDTGTLQITSPMLTANPPSGRIGTHSAIPKYFDAAPGTTMSFTAGATFIDGTNFTGGGTILITSSATFNGTITSTVTNFEVNAPGNTLTWTSATLSGAITAWKQGSFTGTLTTSGSITTAASIGTRVFNNLNLTNNGVLILDGSNLALSNGTVIDNNGTIDFQDDHSLGWDLAGATPTITNDGSIVKSGGSVQAILAAGCNFTSNALLRSQSGTLRVEGISTIGGTVDAVNAGNTVEFPSGPSFSNGTTFSGNGTVLVNSGATFNGTLNQTAALARIDTATSVTFQNAATIVGSMEWKDASLTGTGLTIAGGSTIDVISGAGNVKLDGLALINNGVIELSGASLTLQNGGSLDNQLTVDIQDNFDLKWGGTGAAGSISNGGTIKKTAGGGTSVIGNSSTITNTGTIQANTGNLLVSSPITTSGSFPVGSGSTIEFAGTATFNNGTTFSGLGTIDVSSNATFNGVITVGAATNTIRGTGNTMTFNAATISGGTLTWKESSVTGTGLTVSAGDVLRVVSGVGTAKLDGGVLTVDGDLELSAHLGLRNGATFTLNGGVNFLGGHSFGYDGIGANPVMTLSGTITKNVGTTTASINCGGVCTNTAAGSISASTGILAFTSGLTNNGTITFAINGATPLTDFGRIDVSGGLLTLAGTATAVVNYIPDGGESFLVLTFTTKSGDFVTKNYTFAGTRSFSESYTANDFSLVASGPVIGGLVPSSGGTAGGTNVTISGSGFVAPVTVTFDGIAATNVVINSPTEVTCDTPAHAAGTVDVTLTANGEPHTAFGAFTYGAASPTMSSLSVTFGSLNGGTYVEINGTNLANVNDVDFATANATILSVSASVIKVRTPAGTGTVGVTVSGPDGTATLPVSYTYVVPTCDPISHTMAWFRGEGDASDSAGGTNGTSDGGYAAGKVGNAFSLNGSQHVSVASSAWNTTPDVTIEGWVKFNSVPVGQYAMLFGKTAGTGTFESYAVSYKDGLLYCGVGGPGGITYHTATFTPSVGVWYHVALAFDDATDDLHLYVDGQLALDVVETAVIGYDSHPLTIGAEYENESLAYFFDGLIDEVTLYPRMLSAAEILAIYDTDTAGKCFPAAPLLLSISPVSGAAAGGTSVTITGSSLSSGSATIGGNSLSGSSATQSQITGTTTATAAGTYNVDVTTPAGTAQLASAFTFTSPTTYTSVTNGNWTNPATWGAGSYPQSADTATVNHIVTMDANVTVANLTVNGTGTRLSGSSTLTVTGNFTWNGGDLFAPLTLDTGSTSSITGSAAKILGNTTINNGTINYDSTGTFILHTFGITNNGTFNLQNDTGWQRFGAPVFTNASGAFFNKTGGTGTAAWAGTFVNNGTMTLSSGTLDFTESFSNNNAVSVPAGTLGLSGSGASSGSFSTGTTGAVDYAAGSHTFSGSLSGTGKLKLSGGAVTITGTPSVTNMEMSGGSTTGAGTLAISGQLNWTAGTLGSAMTWGGTTNISGASAHTLMGATTNNGTVNYSTTGLFTLHTNNFTNANAFHLQADGNVVRFGAPLFINAPGATFNKTGGAGNTTWGTAFDNDGTLTIASGSITFSDVFDSSGNVNVGGTSSTLTLTGSGTSSGTFATGLGNGVLSYAGGSHTFSGSFTGSGTMQISAGFVTITGTPSVSNLAVSGGATSGAGTLSTGTTLNWTGGTLGAAMTWNGTTTISGATPLTFGIDGPFTNNGQLNHNGSGTLTVHTNNFTNQGTIIQTTDAAWLRFGGPAFINNGNFQKTTSTGTLPFGVGVDNSAGNIDVQAGSISFSEPHTAGAGTYAFGISSGATNGSMSFAGATSIGSSQLSAYVVGLFVPQGGQTWNVMSPVTGTFASTSTSFGAGRSFGVSYPGANSVLLTASGPTISSVSPNNGPDVGGTSVTITGTGFVATPSVTFGGVSAPSVTFDSATQLTVTTPGGGTGTVNVIVTNPDAQPTTLANGFTFNATAPPAITLLRPNTGNVTGGSTVYIDGTNLDTVTSVVFDSTNATIVTQTPTQLEVLAPAHAAGPVTLTVTNPAGSANQTFTYDDDWNATREFSRTNNPTTGPWRYGQKSGAVFNVLTNSEAYGSQWGWNGGAGFVRPEVAANFSNANLTLATWSLPPFQLMLHPANAGPKSVARWTAPSAGQYQIDATFTGIDSGLRDVSVEINNAVHYSATVNGTASQNTVLNRLLTAGDTVDFIVGDGGNGNSNDATALDADVRPLAGPLVTVTGVSPNFGPTAGGQTVTITGTNFHAGAAVLIGGSPATGVVVNTANQITAVTPAHAAGTVNVVVTHADSADATLTSGYTYGDTGVSISKTAPASVSASQPFSYTITVTNSGPNVATSVSVGDVIQAGMSASNVVAPSFACSGTGTLTCTAATLAVGAHTITFDVTAPASSQAISNVANLAASNDITGGDNTSTAVTNVGGASADLSVTTTPSAGTVAVSGSMTWTSTVTNNGPSPATAVVLTNNLPDGQTVTGTAPSTGSCNTVGGIVTCNFGTLANGNSANVVITVTANEGGTRMNAATADANETDPVPGNDTGTATVTVTGDSTLVVTTNNPFGTGSLWQAITDANAGVCPAPCTISFNMGATVIGVALPPLTASQVTIDATTQPGYPGTMVQLDGSAQTPGTHGLVIQGVANVVQGLSISGYTDGIRAEGSGNLVTQNSVFGNTTGVSVVTGTGNRILGNSIHSNSALPIDHDGDGVVELLDPGDGDSGSNNHQNAPVISSVEITPSDLDVTLSVDTSGVVTTLSILVEVFKTDGSGEPQTFLGSQCVPGNNLVNQLINVPIGSVVAGNSIVATATGSNSAACGAAGDGTSEVSAGAVAGNCVPPSVTITGPAAVCAGGSVTLNAGVHSSYLWTPGNFTTQTISVSPASTTTYTVTVTDASGCASSDTHVVTVNTPAPVTITGPTSTCGASSITLNAGPGTAWLWSPGGETTQTITVSPASTTTYGVTVTDGNGCQASDTHVVTVNTAAPASITASGATTFCTGGSVTLTASAGSSYVWSPGGQTTPSITVTAGGSYSVAVTDGNGCVSNAPPVVVTVNPAPAVVIAGPTATCNSTPVTLDAGPGTSFLWTPGNFTTQTITVSPSSTTTYSVTVTNGSGCTGSDTHTVTVTSSPTATITAPTAICSDSTHTASVGVTPGATYTWSITNGSITGGAGTPSITFQPTGAGNVVLGVTVAAGSCTATGSHTVQVFAAPATPVITAPATVAASTSGHSASIAPQAGATYLWSIAGGTIDGSTNLSAITFSAGTTSPVTLTVTVNLDGCTATSSATVAVTNTPPPPADQADLSISKSAPPSVTAGSTFTYTLNVISSGPAPAFSAIVTDTLPSGLTLLGVSGGAWSCGTSASTITCSMPTINSGTPSSIAITVRAPSQTATLVNTASITSVTEDPDESNNSDSVSTNVVLPSPTCPNAAPALLSPANGSTAFSPVALSWSAVGGATSYDVWVSTEGVLTLAGSTANTSMNVSVGSGVTSWYVVAHGGSGCSSLTSQTFTFTVQPGSNCLNLGKPQITAPSGPTAASPVTIRWTPVPQAIGYRVWISVDGTALQDVGATDGAITLTVNAPAGSITAFVDAHFNGCPPVRSDGVSFEVTEPDPCNGRGAATLISPSNNTQINSSSVELNWSAAPSLNGITPEYRVWAAVDGAAPAVLDTTRETSLRTVFERGRVVWFVETLYPSCASTESARFTFTIPARNECGTARPGLISPNGTTVTSGNVTFSWTGVADAIGYEIYLALGQEAETLIGTVPGGTTTFNYLVPPGNLTWSVKALIDRCPSRESTKGRFTYDPPVACESNDRPVLIEPAEVDTAIASPIDFAWSHPAGATRFEVYAQRAGQSPALIASSNSVEASGVALANGTYSWFVRAFFNGCSPLDSAAQDLIVANPAPACAVIAAPVISAPGQISSGVEFLLQWTPAAAPLTYQLQLASVPSFNGADTITTTATQHALARTNNGTAPIAIYARVRAIDGRCTPPSATPYGPVAAIFVLPRQGDQASTPLANDGPVSYTLNIGAEFAGQTFTAIPNQPWITVAPSSGVVGAGGTNLLVTADTGDLGIGTNLAAVTISLNTPSSRIKTNGTTTVTSTLTINLVSPVTPAPKNTPPPDALIIPAVANADGVNSHFQSDVRVSNTSPQLIKYQLTYTPTGETGIAGGRQTTFSIEPGRTVALDDILKSWFGTGSANSTGTLEVRPLTQTASSTSSAAIGALANLATFASSRTFNVTPNGTFGQHIPAIPFANFIGKASAAAQTNVLSLQQIAQSSKYRTNLGVVEGSGESASLLIKVFGSTGAPLAQFPVQLKGGQHMQMNSVLAQHGVTDLTDGRIEVEVTSGNGKVTAYASVLDNETSDPLLVSPVALSGAGNSKWVIPGVADLNNGVANWQTDMRVFNAGTTDVDATLTFHSQNGGEPKTTNITIPAGQVRTLDRTLANTFGASNDGGAVHISTPASARLIATARTYNQTTGGTYGQFISAVTPAEAAGVGTRPLQLLQVEESDRFRSNIGLAEVTGNPVKLEISVIPPDAKFTAVAQVELGPNEFRQIGSLLRSVGLSDTYNARVTVRAIEGTGRVAAYASIIDMQTNDPTYVGAQ
jgi:uncharacterized repeat protein (TIGR01451 family)